MVGKFLIFALVCVSCVQVQGNELENAIKKGLYRAKGLKENGERQIDVALKEVSYKAKLIQSRGSDFVQKSVRIQDGTREALRSVAYAMEEKANEMNKPESVFECIKKAEQNANNQVETLTNTFKTDIDRLERVKLANIETDSKPLQGMQESLTARYEKTVSEVQRCENTKCVDTTVSSFARWLDLLFADIRRILGQVSTVFTNFQRDAGNYFNNSNRQITRIKSTAMRIMRECVFRREGIFQGY